MKLLLKDDVDNLGRRGDVVDVKPGFARNFLIPRRIGIEVTAENLRLIDVEKKKISVREEKRKDELVALKRRLEAVRYIIKSKVSEDGHLYGSVGEREVADSVRDTIKVEIEQKSVVIEKPIKETGLYEVPVHLHAEIVANLKVWVVDEEGKDRKPEKAAGEPAADDAAGRSEGKARGKK